MKKLLLSLFILVAVQSAIAQPTLTSTLNPYVGYNAFMKPADSVGINPGPAGANQTWTYTLNAGEFPDPASFLASAGTPYAAMFPGANVAQNSGGAYSYLLLDNDEYTLLGVVGSGSGYTYSVVYSDYMTLHTYPFDYNTTYTDNFGGTYIVAAGGDTIVNDRTGDHTATYDGYGTLVVNGVTANNVARVKYVENYVDSNEFMVTDSHIETYDWFSTTGPDLLMSISFSDVGGFISKAVRVSTTMLTGLADVNASANGIAVTPSIVNKTNSSLLIKSQASHVGNYEILNALGQVITTNPYSAHSGVTTLSLPSAGLVPGIYFVRIIDSEGNVSAAQKLLVQ
jgi:hypothetical protein